VPANCLLPMKVGPCRARVPRFYYNSSSGKCEGFTYGGCGANANKFQTKAQCEKACA
uniref:PI-actitoxin-Afv2b n=1 Tax=Anthopleura fuscoviridis TaxID=6111 RepID=VKTI3_ANTFU|nr:RecName: Full=PI-actitoxin-Afv2b; Short=PI-AITX-Afv2b; AltName: Full=Kunitz-type protease inhibitor AFAPI-III [Anthopleura fuscoviridis]